MNRYLFLAAALALLCCAATTADGHRYKVMLGWSQTWSLPANATNAVVTLWGAGGGGASTESCGAGGGSGAAIMGRAMGDASWGVDPSLVQWAVTVGQGGAALTTPNRGGVAGNGGDTSVVATAPNGTELFRATAYGGGGAYAVVSGSRRGCKGGAGGGAASAAANTEPGLGNPAGAADNSLTAAATQGATAGDIKAGGAGAGYGYQYNVDTKPFTAGAPWTSTGREWLGGPGILTDYGCYGWGGAAGFNGRGGDYQSGGAVFPPPANSGSGGGSAYVCPSGRTLSDSPGAAGGVIVEYTHPVSPVVALKSRTNYKYLTAHSHGGVSANAATVQAWERWTAIRFDDGKYAFRSYHGKYLKANPTDSVEATATAVGGWEKFDVAELSTTVWRIKNHYGKYLEVAPDGFVYSGTNADHLWEIVFL
ncbi:Fascin-like domain-containing protein [Pandoravirus kuranda]|uniref:Fascin-like domain-containing protein n=2 Tax=Pandoravirus TaxID=2060084 RepID=A0AA95EDL0_9VIRU|nr:Fascin-like incomplete domain containing protein [Pandoravirus neocaledonia]AVK76374.1 Fascin-like incomplete domain containing protein [Pandoravirus neocaledonia]WBR14870.1 Fascin-like domain-containing protein [Pandoravirus kuranda]